MRTGYGHSVLEYYVTRVRAIHAARAERLKALSSRVEALAYQAHVRAAIQAAFGPWPARTPLNACITGVVEQPLYRIEKIVFESRPGCLVTANLYLPRTLNGPAPAVLGTCGHSEDGKAEPLYQAFCQRLVHSGFVVLIYDPINQGERDQYIGLAERESVAVCTHAHNMMGKQLELIGENLAMWRAWDGIRALDYLLTRPEVDPRHVGVTGNSGGGTLTTWLWALDERFMMAAPSCFITTFLHNLENELPADAEQYPPGVLGAGLELADFLIAGAPKPLLILGQHYDFFDRRGFQEACAELRRFYALLGAPEAVDCFLGPWPHGFFQENQEAMVAFFARQTGVDVRPLAQPEPLSANALWATPTGNVIDAGGRPIYALIGERAAALHPPALTAEALADRLAALLHLPAIQAPPYYRNLRPTRQGEHTYARYAIETEGALVAILHKKMAQPYFANTLDVDEEAHLYLPHLASEEDLAGDPLALTLQAQYELYALDVRGLGELLPDEEGSFWHPYGLDYMFHGHSLLLGESYLGRRVLDVVRTLDLLEAQGARRLYLYGRGQGALLALFAALLRPQVVAVTLKNAPRSYREWAAAPLLAWPAANGLPGVLRAFDLDDCFRALGDKLTLLEPWDARMRPILEA